MPTWPIGIDLDPGDEGKLRHRLIELGISHTGETLPDLRRTRGGGR